jgi:hypothetical protein
MRARLVELPDGNLVNPVHVAAVEYLPPYPGARPGSGVETHRVMVTVKSGRNLFLACESAEDARAKRSRIGAIVNGQDTEATTGGADWGTMMSVREDLVRVAGMSGFTLGPITTKVVAQMVPAGTAVKLGKTGYIKTGYILGPPTDAVNDSGLHFDGRGRPVEPSPEASLPAELRPAAESDAIARPPRGGYF